MTFTPTADLPAEVVTLRSELLAARHRKIAATSEVLRADPDLALTMRLMPQYRLETSLTQGEVQPIVSLEDAWAAWSAADSHFEELVHRLVSGYGELGQEAVDWTTMDGAHLLADQLRSLSRVREFARTELQLSPGETAALLVSFPSYGVRKVNVNGRDVCLSDHGELARSAVPIPSLRLDSLKGTQRVTGEAARKVIAEIRRQDLFATQLRNWFPDPASAERPHDCDAVGFRLSRESIAADAAAHPRRRIRFPQWLGGEGIGR